jgi:hypothetical protein
MTPLPEPAPETMAAPARVGPTGGRAAVPAVAVYLGAAFLSILIAALILKLWKADLAVPFGYEWRDMRQSGGVPDALGSGDNFLFAAMIKGVHDNGWFEHNDYLGAPDGLDLYDYPFLENLHFFLIKLISFVSPSYGVTYNLYFLLSFPLITIASLYAFRAFELSWPSAVFASLVYTFLPYHFLRGEQHIFLAAYYLVPLTCMVILWVAAGEPLWRVGRHLDPLRRLTSKGWISLAVCALSPATGVYYGAFAAYLIFIAALLAWHRQRQLRPLAAGGLLLLVLFVSACVNVSPSLFYHLLHGPNPEAFVRLAWEAEYNALKIVQMLFPICQHRIPFLSQLAVHYVENDGLAVGESSTACLGLIGSGGFLVLLAYSLGFKWPSSRSATIENLSALNLAALLLATVGGFSAVFAFSVSPVLRSYNRMSIYLAFFAVLLVAFLLERWQVRWFGDPRRQKLWWAALAVLLFLGIADQTSPVFEPLYAENAAAWNRDREFVQRIESALPEGAMVFQIPYPSFPATLPDHAYDFLRGYLHSSKLRWGCACMQGRRVDHWVRNDVMQGNSISMSAIMAAGFAGIYVDRVYLTEDNHIIDALKAGVDPAPLTSSDGRLLFFNFAHAGAKR